MYVNKYKLMAKCVKVARFSAPIVTGNLRENGIYGRATGGGLLQFKVIWDDNAVPYMNVVDRTSKHSSGFIDRGKSAIRSVIEEYANTGTISNQGISNLKNNTERRLYIEPLRNYMERKILVGSGNSLPDVYKIQEKYEKTQQYRTDNDYVNTTPYSISGHGAFNQISRRRD